MKKIIFITNHEVPYRVEFFNELSKKCMLTVVYENRKNSTRNSKWSESVVSNKKYEVIYLSDKSKQRKISFKIFKYIFRKI